MFGLWREQRIVLLGIPVVTQYVSKRSYHNAEYLSKLMLNCSVLPSTFLVMQYYLKDSRNW